MHGINPTPENPIDPNKMLEMPPLPNIFDFDEFQVGFRSEELKIRTQMAEERLQAIQDRQHDAFEMSGILAAAVRIKYNAGVSVNPTTGVIVHPYEWVEDSDVKSKLYVANTPLPRGLGRIQVPHIRLMKASKPNTADVAIGDVSPGGEHVPADGFNFALLEGAVKMVRTLQNSGLPLSDNLLAIDRVKLKRNLP